jgi:hypothetical protein
MNVHAERCATFRRSASRKPPPKDKSVRRLLRALAVHVEPFPSARLEHRGGGAAARDRREGRRQEIGAKGRRRRGSLIVAKEGD